MARPRKPTHILELNGAFKRNPSRRRDRVGEPLPEGSVNEPHESMSPAERECYVEIARCAPQGLLCRADTFAVEFAARLLAGYRADPIRYSQALQNRLVSILAKLGMNPVDRTRLGC